VAGYRNKATQQYTVCFGINNTASGDKAIVLGGETTTASGEGSLACGRINNASGRASIALGYTANATGAQSVVLGGEDNMANATNSISVGGNQTLANRAGMFAHANGMFAAQGDAQRARFVLRNKTTTNAAVELFLDGSATRLTIPSGKVLGLTINITGIKSDGSAVAHYLRQYALKNVAGTCTEVYAPVTIGSDNAAGTSIALSAYDVGATEALRVEVTGIAGETWRWVASVDAVEIAYGL
jgi:hypothetical protein